MKHIAEQQGCLGYAKTHKKPRNMHVSVSFESFYCEYRSYVNSLDLSKSSKCRRMLLFTKFIVFLEECGVSDLSECRIVTAYDFINSFSGYEPTTMCGYKTDLAKNLNRAYINLYSYDENGKCVKQSYKPN